MAAENWAEIAETSGRSGPLGMICSRGPREAAGNGAQGGEILHGQGFAYARYVHSKWPGFGAAWSAWVADVEVNRRTGEVHVRRVVCGHDAAHDDTSTAQLPSGQVTGV